ncbi:MAG: hypothetical protein A2Y56_05435 [Candidatus Aminicenantes bacterium RBG_13_63_10]|nr:MAG: hypothetical protein A2Y56_05435 [Candidatus Aminicenantes bacterium RBG_13_63_10]
MNKSFTLRAATALVTAAVLVTLAALPLRAANPPRIKFREESWNFGKVKQTAVLEHEFVFKNTGGAKLTIHKVETSCGCTAALATEKTLEPGQEGKVKVSFNTLGYSGEVTKNIYVDSDDSNDPRVVLKITATVEVPPAPRAELSPYNQDVGLILEGDGIETKLTVMNRGELELQLDNSQKNVVFMSGSKRVTFPLKIASGKEAALSLKMTLPNRVGPLRSEYIVFKTNDPQQATLYFTLSGYIMTKAQLKELFNRYKDTLK